MPSDVAGWTGHLRDFWEEMNRKQRRAEKKQAKPAMQAASPGLQEVFAAARQQHQAGRLNEAERLYRQVLAVDPRNAECHHLLGGLAYQLGRYDLAVDAISKAIAINAKVPEYHSNLGLTLKAQGKLDEAVACYRQALVLKPGFAEAHINLGNALRDQGKLDEAVACYRQALVLRPDYAGAHINLGTALKDQGKLDEAVACYRQALVVRPDFAEAHNNLGNALGDQGKLDEAVACYRQVLVLSPGFAEAHYNLGNALGDQGKLDEAVACYRQALALKPDYVEAHNNLALLLLAQGKVLTALNIIKQSLQIKDSVETKKIFVGCIKRLHCTNDDSEVRIAVVRALTEPWGRPSQLVRVSTDLVKLNPEIGKCVARAADAWPRLLSAQDLFGSNGLAALAADELLCALLSSTPISDIEMERFLTMARRLMLENDQVGAALSFYSALARQCFINEYVFSYTDSEIQKASDLRDLLVAALEAKTQVPALWVLTVAAYFPLCSLPLAARLLELQWPAAITALLLQQVREPQEELQLRTTIPRLTDIENDVSRLVRNSIRRKSLSALDQNGAYRRLM